jgi:hypothetical protein
MLFCTGKILVENILGGFSSWLWMGGFSWYRIKFPWHFFFFSLVSATSSCADDIAYT